MIREFRDFQCAPCCTVYTGSGQFRNHPCHTSGRSYTPDPTKKYIRSVFLDASIICSTLEGDHDKDFSPVQVVERQSLLLFPNRKIGTDFAKHNQSLFLYTKVPWFPPITVTSMVNALTAPSLLPSLVSTLPPRVSRLVSLYLFLPPDLGFPSMAKIRFPLKIMYKKQSFPESLVCLNTPYIHQSCFHEPY